jgi:hypothetical protein
MSRSTNRPNNHAKKGGPKKRGPESAGLHMEHWIIPMSLSRDLHPHFQDLNFIGHRCENPAYMGAALGNTTGSRTLS